MINQKTERRLIIMEATRATTTAVIDGAATGSVTEVPPDDPVCSWSERQLAV